MGGSSGGELLASITWANLLLDRGNNDRPYDWDTHPTLFADRDSPGGDSWMVLSILVLQSL